MSQEEQLLCRIDTPFSAAGLNFHRMNVPQVLELAYMHIHYELEKAPGLLACETWNTQFLSGDYFYHQAVHCDNV